MSCKLSLETICMKCQILFSGKNKNYLIKVSSAESAHSMVSVEEHNVSCYNNRLTLSILKLVDEFL